MPGESTFAPRQHIPLSESYPHPQKHFVAYSDDAADSTLTAGQHQVIPLPSSEFEPYYSEFSNYESELDQPFLDVQDLGIAHPPSYAIPATDPGPFYPAARLSQFAMGLSSDPPEIPQIAGADLSENEDADDNQHRFDDLSSSPPASPQKLPISRTNPVAPPPLPRVPQNLDMLGISHPHNHYSRPSISRIIPNSESSHTQLSSSAGVQTLSGPTLPGMRSPYVGPPIPNTPVSPYALNRNRPDFSRLPVYDLMSAPSTLPRPLHNQQQHQQQQHSSNSAVPQQLRSMPSMPNLSPALSDASSVSPDLGSPDGLDDAFTWQPILTAPRSEQSEAIIEQQRKPKQKRRSCLPDGVVEEYVGATDYEGVYMCLYPNCQRLFKRTYNLRSHIQTHLCDRPYICKVCHSNFVRPHDLRRHERCHSSDKPFECPCGKRFNRQDALQRHRLREICEGAIHTGIPKSPKPRGRPKGRRNTPTTSPDLSEDVKGDFS